MFDLFWVPNYIKFGNIAIHNVQLHCTLFLIPGHDPQFQISYLWLRNLTSSDCLIIFLLWHQNFLEWGNWYFFKYLLLGCNVDFRGGYLAVTAHYLVVTAGYCLLPRGYWWLLLITGGYCSLPLITARSHF